MTIAAKLHTVIYVLFVALAMVFMSILAVFLSVVVVGVGQLGILKCTEMTESPTACGVAGGALLMALGRAL